MIEKIAFIHQSAWDIEEVAEIINSGLPNSVECGSYRARAYSDNNEARLIATAAGLGYYSFDDDELEVVTSMMDSDVKAVLLCSSTVSRKIVAIYVESEEPTKQGEEA